MANYLITGGSGLVGSALAAYLVDSGQEVTILSRNPARQGVDTNRIRYKHWDPYNETIDETAIREADYIIHLAGANVAEKRWTAKRKQEILESRVQSGRFLAATLKSIPNQVKAFLGASAQGWYGPDPIVPNPTPFLESDPSYPDFLGNTCRAWEESVQSVQMLGIRLIQLRIGIVMSLRGGALAEFRKPVRFGISPILGSGKQMISWIHINDLVSMICWSLQHPSIAGIFNAAAPNPVSNYTLMKSLAKASGRPFLPVPVPSFLLKIGLGEMSIEILKSTTISADKIQQAGFVFAFPKIELALQDLLDK